MGAWVVESLGCLGSLFLAGFRARVLRSRLLGLSTAYRQGLIRGRGVFQCFMAKGLISTGIACVLHLCHSAFLWGSRHSGDLAVLLEEGAYGLCVLRSVGFVGRFFCLAQVGVFTATGGRVLSASNSTMVTIFILGARVTKIWRIVFVGRFHHDFQILVVPLRNIVSAITRFSLCARQAFLVYFQVGSFRFHGFRVTPGHIAARVG